jgi:hypothetical protein
MVRGLSDDGLWRRGVCVPRPRALELAVVALELRRVLIGHPVGPNAVAEGRDVATPSGSATTWFSSTSSPYSYALFQATLILCEVP